MNTKCQNDEYLNMDVHNTQLHRSLQGKWYTQTESASGEAEGNHRKEMKDAVQTKDKNASVLLSNTNTLPIFKRITILTRHS